MLMSNSKVILIIDDDPDDTELFCDAVKEVDESIKCIFVNNAQDAFKLLSAKDSSMPDYIFLDLNIPGINGKQLLRQIKKTEELRDIPVIIYTTSKLPEDIEETKRLGAIYFLTKPSKLSTLKKTIACVLAGEWASINSIS